MACPLSDMTPAPTKQHITGSMFLQAEGCGDVSDLHSARPHAAHLAHDVFGKDGFVMAFTARLQAIGYRMSMVFLRCHPFKVFNAVIQSVKVFVVDGPSGYANWSGRFAKKCKSDQLVNTRHPLLSFVLQKYKVVLLDQHFGKLAASHFSPVCGVSRRSSDKSGIADFVNAKRVARHWFPDDLFHGNLDSIQLFKFPGVPIK